MGKSKVPPVQTKENVHQTITSDGLVIAHCGTRAATVTMPNGSLRVELGDIPQIKELLDRIAKTLVKNGN